MAICGFCKKEVTLKGAQMKAKQEYYKKSKPDYHLKPKYQTWEDTTVIYEFYLDISMFSCPHCGSILSITRKS